MRPAETRSSPRLGTMEQWRFTHYGGSPGKAWACTNLWAQWEVPMSAEGAAWCHCEATPDNLCTVMALRSLKTGRKQMSLVSSRRERGLQRTTGWSVSPWSLGRGWNKLCWKLFLNTLKTRKWLGVISMDLWRGKHVWPTWQTSTTKSFAWWRRGEWGMIAPWA